MNVCMIKWNPETDVTEIQWTADFMRADWVVRADVLKDVSFDMAKMYHEILRAQVSAGRSK